MLELYITIKLKATNGDGMEKKRCYIYTRVSTAAQVEGYSLDAQKQRLYDYAKYRDLEVVGEYSDEGISGASVSGRVSFQQMISDVMEGKDGVSFVLVFKLSRFGRNSADVLKYMQLLLDYGVDLVSVEESIDSSTQSGKMMLTIMSAVAEIEKENIRAQFAAGFQEKLNKGGWPGGPVPYGYHSVNSELVVNEEEAGTIRRIFRLFVDEGMSYRAIAHKLGEEGILRRYGEKRMAFEDRHVKAILSQPIYCGTYIHNLRSKTDQKVFQVKGYHEAIVSRELWDKAQEIRENIQLYPRHEDGHVSLLSGIVKCPFCGRGMYRVVSRKKRSTGERYKTINGYMCPNRAHIGEEVCSFRRQYNQEKIHEAVREIIGRTELLPEFNEMLDAEFGNADLELLTEQQKNVRKKIYSKESEKNRLGRELDNLDISDAEYLNRYEELENRIEEIYVQLSEFGEQLNVLDRKIEVVKQGLITGEKIRNILHHFNELYDQMTEAEKKEFYQNLLERVDVFAEKRSDRRLIRSITFRFPMFCAAEESEAEGSFWVYTLDCTRLSRTRAESHTTYAGIQDYIKKQYGVHVSSLYIAQIKRKYGLVERECYRTHATGHVPVCPKEKEKLIVAALRHYKEIA